MESSPQQQKHEREVEEQSKDEVDFINVSNNNNNNINNNNNKLDLNKTSWFQNLNNANNKNKNKALSLFTFGRRSSEKSLTEKIQKDAQNLTLKKEKEKEKGVEIELPKVVKTHKFVKSSSISRLLGNAANKADKQQQQQNENSKLKTRKFNTYGGRRRGDGAFLERFKRYAKEDSDISKKNENNSNNNNNSSSNAIITTTTTTATTKQRYISTKLTMDSRDLFGGSRSELVSVQRSPTIHEDVGVKAMRTLSRSLGKLWWRRANSVDISTPDPEFKVSYLGNVLTGWAKGEGCVEKQLNTLWRNYTQNTKPDVIMRIKVCASGLKATTRQHGLTEYWANRITHCCAPTNYPRVFCWVYRHEGRKMKHELRCHAVLCSKEKFAEDISNTLKENLECALRDFKREKILKQNARLSLANAAYDNPSLPRRKILLSVGGNNYRPPLERSKSAPKLMAIEEAIGEEEGEDAEETNEPEMRSCCQKDSLYPAMTLGRRRCRRGHSIRRTGKLKSQLLCMENHNICAITENEVKITEPNPEGSDESFEKLLRHNNYDVSNSLTNELIPYFDMQLHKNNSQSLGSLCDLKHEEDEEPLSLVPTINSDPNADPESDLNPLRTNTTTTNVILRRDGVCSDGEEDYLDAEDEEAYFERIPQVNVLQILQRESMRKMAQLSLNSYEDYLPNQHDTQSSISSDVSSNSMRNDDADKSPVLQKLATDSDEGSISSGCETASISTTNQYELAWRFPVHTQLQNSLSLHTEEPGLTAEEIYQRLESRLKTTFSSSSSLTLKLSGPETSPTSSLCALDNLVTPRASFNSSRHQSVCDERNNSDSECSDESGYVEEKDMKSASLATAPPPQAAKRNLKPPGIPPKPMPRRLPTPV